MPIFTLDEKDAMLDASNIGYVSLHTAYDARGGNEVVGGSPAYARLAVTFAPASGGQKPMLTPPTFDIPPNTTAQFIGMWGPDGTTFLGMTPLGGDGLRPFTVTGLLDIDCPNHGFAANDMLVVWSASAGTLPLELTEGTVYTVLIASAHTLQLSDTIGGSAISFSVPGNGFLQRIVPVTYTSQGTFPVSSFVLDARAAA